MLNTEKVREIMRARDLNTSKLSKKIGISPQHLSNILGSTRGLSTETLSALAQALEVEVAEIFDDPQNQNEPQFLLSTQGDGAILIEKTNRIRITLPANEDSYEFVKQLIHANAELDDKIQKLLIKADKETKEKILNLLEIRQDDSE